MRVGTLGNVVSLLRDNYNAENEVLRLSIPMPVDTFEEERYVWT